MREALARSDHDFVVSEPTRGRRAPPRRKLFAGLAAILRFCYQLSAYPNRIAGALVFGLAIAIMVNALLLQNSRHPAPLFGRSFALPTRVAPAVIPRARPAGRATSKPMPDPIGRLIKAERATATAQHALLGRRPLTPPMPADLIAQILRATAARPAEKAEPEAERSQTVVAVQKALVKLGYVLREDGRMGEVTHRAIEQYERERRLPLSGELTPRLMHRLAAESGLPIE